MKEYIKNYFWIAIAFVGLNIGAASVYADIDAGDYDGAEYYYGNEGEVRWIGPGYYGGVWFDNEDDFNSYHKHNHDGDGHHDGDYRDGEHRGGDYHGGGGRGGGHR